MGKSRSDHALLIAITEIEGRYGPSPSFRLQPIQEVREPL